VQQLEVANGVAPAVEVLLSRGIEAAFRILDATTGQSIDTYGVSIMDVVTRSSIYSGAPPADATGLRRITLQPGTYTLIAFAQGYTPPRPVTLTVPGPPVDLRLERQKQP
jgi:hypothetical protein